MNKTAANETRDELREMIEHLNNDQIIYSYQILKNLFFPNIETFQTDLSVSYKNGIREKIAHCTDTEFMDLVWRLCSNHLPEAQAYK